MGCGSGVGLGLGSDFELLSVPAAHRSEPTKLSDLLLVLFFANEFAAASVFDIGCVRGAKNGTSERFFVRNFYDSD